MTLPSDISFPRLGDYEVRLAQTPQEIEATQRLRYQIFFEEMGAKAAIGEIPTPGLDIDIYDAASDHLIVLDHSLGSPPHNIVATYRLRQRKHAAQSQGFYTETEFDISKLKAASGEILEFGRSCIDKRYRNSGIMQLLWNGLSAYVFYYDVKILFGCASFHGLDPIPYKEAFAFLHHYCMAPDGICPQVLKGHDMSLDLLPKESIDTKLALRELPPLIKGYVRLGCKIGQGAFVDKAFNTIDVCIVLSRESVTPKYRQHYEKT